MNDPYSVLGISQGADEETIKKAYRQKCKQYHPDLHPDDPTCEDKFKEVQAAYSEIMRQRSGGGAQGGAGRQAGGTASGRYSSQSGYGQQYQDPFGFGFDPFGFGFGGYTNAGSSYGRQESPEMQAANNYIRNGYYTEALNVLNGIPASDRNARWHYYAALANSGLGNNIRAQSEARTAVDMEPGNYEYQNLLDRLQNPGRTYSSYQQAYTQPGSRQHGANVCLQAWLYLMLLNLCSICCCGRGGFFCC
ncbi:MAG: J domain-containing protein [Gemmiger sp.]|uniref:J domain-containing protein n=1 Tax=Gemmiger sp. TaxID=2049027 RepID=UPI002E75C138|nr:J domain-containing protein [Gemmiger sp.]MEE0801421.1 J domain-containing protein [Gemmiger sp.]